MKLNVEIIVDVMLPTPHPATKGGRRGLVELRRFYPMVPPAVGTLVFVRENCAEEAINPLAVESVAWHTETHHMSAWAKPVDMTSAWDGPPDPLGDLSESRAWLLEMADLGWLAGGAASRSETREFIERFTTPATREFIDWFRGPAHTPEKAEEACSKSSSTSGPAGT